jgi:hypothetical protein
VTTTPADDEVDFDPDAKPDDFDTAMGQALAEAAGSAPRHNVGGSDDAEREPLMFEGREVKKTEVVIKGLTGLSEAYEGLRIGMDDRVRLVVETRATKVNHYVDKDGELVRSQELKVLVADIVPWDPTNPSDDGILRA